MSQRNAIAYLSQGLLGVGYPLLSAGDVRLGVDRGDGTAGTLRPYPEAPPDEADNALVALRALLLDRAALVALVGERIYCQNFPSAARAILPCVLLFRVGGTDDPNMDTVAFPRYEIQCAGRTQLEAQRVYAQIKPLNGQCHLEAGGHFFHFLEETAAGKDALIKVSESADWDAVLSQWTAEISKASA